MRGEERKDCEVLFPPEMFSSRASLEIIEPRHRNRLM